MARYNLFHHIHKAQKALLYDTSMLLQRTDFTMEEEAKEAISRLPFVVALFERYQYAEDIYVLPTMTAYEPGVADSFEQDHRRACQLGKSLESLLHAFSHHSLPLEKTAVGNTIITRFEELMLFHIQHMGREEQVISKILWRYYTDAELQRLAWTLIAGSGGRVLSLYTQWILRGLNNNEIVGWLNEVKRTAPEHEFQSLLQTVETELQPGRLALVQNRLFSGIMAA